MRFERRSILIIERGKKIKGNKVALGVQQRVNGQVVKTTGCEVLLAVVRIQTLQ